MLISIPTTSAKLGSLLSADQKSQAEASICRQDGTYTVVITNTGANAVYVEMGGTATTTGSKPIAATTGEFAFVTDNLDKPRVIAATGATDVRVNFF